MVYSNNYLRTYAIINS